MCKVYLYSSSIYTCTSNYLRGFGAAKYAPQIGGLGLDMESVTTRLGAYKEAFSFEDTHDDEVQEQLDKLLTYLREISCYQAVSISRGIYMLYKIHVDGSNHCY